MSEIDPMPNSNTIKIDPCKFCAAIDLWINVNSVRTIERTIFNWRMECEYCGACGPICATRRTAAKAWNAHPPKSHDHPIHLLTYEKVVYSDTICIVLVKKFNDPEDDVRIYDPSVGHERCVNRDDVTLYQGSNHENH